MLECRCIFALPPDHFSFIYIPCQWLLDKNIYMLYGGMVMLFILIPSRYRKDHVTVILITVMNFGDIGFLTSMMTSLLSSNLSSLQKSGYGCIK